VTVSNIPPAGINTDVHVPGDGGVGCHACDAAVLVKPNHDSSSRAIAIASARGDAVANRRIVSATKQTDPNPVSNPPTTTTQTKTLTLAASLASLVATMIVYLHSLLAAVQLGQVGHLEAGLAAVVAASELVVSLLAAAAAEVILILGLAGKAAGQEVHSTHTIQVQAWAVVVEWVWAATLEAAAEEEAVVAGGGGQDSSGCNLATCRMFSFKPRRY